MADRLGVAVSTLQKRGGYTGSKPGKEMRPPVHRPSAVAAKPAVQTPADQKPAAGQQQ